MYSEVFSDGEIQTCSYIFKIKAHFSRDLTLKTDLSVRRSKQVAGRQWFPGLCLSIVPYSAQGAEGRGLRVTVP